MNTKEALDCLGIQEFDSEDDLSKAAQRTVSTGIALGDLAYIRKACEAYVVLLCEAGFLDSEDMNEVLEGIYARINVQSIDQEAARFRDEVLNTRWYKNALRKYQAKQFKRQYGNWFTLMIEYYLDQFFPRRLRRR